MCMLKYYLVNRGIAVVDADTDWSLFKVYERSMEVCYKRWIEWVRKSHPKELAVVNRKVIGIKGERAAMLSPQSVREHFTALTACLKRCGILNEQGNIVHPNRVWACDEIHGIIVCFNQVHLSSTPPQLKVLSPWSFLVFF